MYQQKNKKTFIEHVTEFILLLGLVFLIRTFFFGLYQVPTPSMESTMLVGERFAADKLTYWFRMPTRGEIIAFNDPEYVYSKNKFIRLFEKYVWGPSNWTKRVVGIPGDIVEGRLEDGKPVIYINGAKFDEPYINQLPIIHLWTDDPEVLRETIEKELTAIMRGGRIAGINMEQLLMQKWAQRTTFRTYDPDKSYHEQPFYRIDEKRVIKNQEGNPDLLWPATPINQNTDVLRKQNKRYWNKTDSFYVELGMDEYWCMGDNRLGSKDSRFLGPIKVDQIHGRILFRIWSVDSDESWALIDLLKHPIDFWTRVRWSRFLQMVY
ncbi:MAG TPA: signal peptidase I [Patescibacteria group bacterium]|jgi:signal peptidase I|nr:signal peptidase I [Patescibacteria group bacterium]